MAYPDLDLGKIGPGMPLDPSNLEALYKGMNKTNGFLMRNVDGRIPALQQPIGRLRIDLANVLSEKEMVPWGNALWRDISAMETAPGIAHAQKPTKGFLCGVLKFNQGWQAGHPVAPYGLPDYSKGTIITKGLVGYKTAMVSATVADDYLAYLTGDATKDNPTIRTTYKEWMAAYTAATVTDGSKLGLFFDNLTGFPIVSVVAAANLAAPTLAGATFAGFGVVFERENETVFFDINL